MTTRREPQHGHPSMRFVEVDVPCPWSVEQRLNVVTRDAVSTATRWRWQKDISGYCGWRRDTADPCGYPFWSSLSAPRLLPSTPARTRASKVLTVLREPAIPELLERCRIPTPSLYGVVNPIFFACLITAWEKWNQQPWTETASLDMCLNADTAASSRPAIMFSGAKLGTASFSLPNSAIINWTLSSIHSIRAHYLLYAITYKVTIICFRTSNLNGTV